MRKTVIHIGANKAASTTLQRALFSNHSGLHYLGEDAAEYQEYCDVVNSMVSDDDLHFSADKCENIFSSHLEKEPHKTLLYSNEDIMTSRVPFLCAKRLKRLLPNSEIILIIRNQFTAIPSFYANHGAFLRPAPSSYFCKHVSFDDWMNYQLLFIKYGALASYFYNRLLAIYAQLFGVNHTHVFLFEEFVEDKEMFFKKLCAVLDIDTEEAITLIDGRHERKRITKRMLAYNRIRSVFFWSNPIPDIISGKSGTLQNFHHFLESGPSANIVLKNEWREKIYNLYAEENTALSLIYNLSIKKYGYPTN